MRDSLNGVNAQQHGSGGVDAAIGANCDVQGAVARGADIAAECAYSDSGLANQLKIGAHNLRTNAGTCGSRCCSAADRVQGALARGSSNGCRTFTTAFEIVTLCGSILQDGHSR